MTISNDAFSAGLADAVAAFHAGGTEATLSAAILTLLNDWAGLQVSNPALAAQMSNLVASWNGRELEFRDWVGGSATGGPSNNGLYPMTNGLGVTSQVPCPAKLAAVIAKGDPGLDAKTDVAFWFQGQIGAGEVLARFVAPGAMAFSVAACRANAKGAPAMVRTIALTKNGAAWASVAWTSGQNAGAWTIASPALAGGDIVEVIAPTPQDTAFTDISMTLAGG